ncbi:MAG: helix-turn-helix transcriptional regulator [Galactobacter sp.]
MSTQTQQPSKDFARAFPTRHTELNRIAHLLNTGRSVIVVCLAGDGPAALANELGRQVVAAGEPPADVLRCSAHTTAATLESFLSHVPSTHPRILVAPGLLPDAAVEIVDQALQPGQAPVAFFADGDRLRSVIASDTVGGQLAAAWQNGDIDRLDLAPLTDHEIESVILDRLGTGVLDDLQVRTLIALADGQPLLARDLVDDATAYPERVPRRYPRPGVDTATFGSLALSRMTARINRMDPSLAQTAARLAQLSPLPMPTASRLFGESELSQLVGNRLATESMASGQRTLTVSPLYSAAMGEHGSSVFDDIEFSSRLISLWRSGYPVNEAILLGLSHSLMRAPAPVSSEQADLVLAAAAAANRLGDGMEAKALLATAQRSSELSQEQQNQATLEGLKAHLNLGEHPAALAAAESLVAHTTDPVDFEWLYHAAVATAWTPETPDWWTDLLDSPLMAAWPGAATALTCFIGESTGSADPTVDMDVVGHDPTNSVEVRLLALSFSCAAHVNLNNGAALEQSVVAGMRLADEVMARPRSERSDFLLSLVALFQLSASTSATFAGVQVDRTRVGIMNTIGHATALTSRSGWNYAMCSGWMAAASRAVEGDEAAARLDFKYADAMVRPAFFPLMWCMHAGFSAVLLTTLGQRRELTPYFAQRARQVLRPRAKAALGLLATAEQGDLPDFVAPDAPAWAPRMALTALWSAKRMTLAEIVGVLDTIPPSTLPAGLAQERHLRAAASGDPDELMKAGQALVSTGQTANARMAFIRARALFLGRRSVAKATAAGQSLSALEGSGAVAAVPTRVPDSAVPLGRASTLSERELEVAQLIAEGLTNVQIAQRLVLSVRTVESHVLQARAKLNVAKRRDIPGALLEVHDAD